MTMTRNELKKLIKECLVEILTEGVGTALTERVATKTSSLRNTNTHVMPRANQAPSQQRRVTSADFMHVGAGQNTQAVTNMVNTVTRDPILASILADTAKTTMIEQAEDQRQVLPSGGDHASRIAAAYDPGQLIAAMTGQSEEQQHARWAQAAFASPRKFPGASAASMFGFDPYAVDVTGK